MRIRQSHVALAGALVASLPAISAFQEWLAIRGQERLHDAMATASAVVPGFPFPAAPEAPSVPQEVVPAAAAFEAAAAEPSPPAAAVDDVEPAPAAHVLPPDLDSYACPECHASLLGPSPDPACPRMHEA